MPINKTNVRRDGKQQYRVRVNYTDSQGVHRQRERIVYGAAEARAAELELMQEVAASPRGHRGLTIRQLFEEYTAAHAHEVRESSMVKFRQRIRNHVLPAVGGLRVDRLTAAQAQKWKQNLGDSTLSVATKNNALKSFSALLNYAVRMEYIAKNPLTSLGRFSDPYITEAPPAVRISYYTPEQFTLFMDAARRVASTDIAWGAYVFFAIAFYTGMRKGEINALRWGDVDGDTLHVRRSVCQNLNGADVETAPKNRSSIRDIEVPAPLLRILAEHRLRLSPEENALVCGAGRPLRDATITYYNQRFADAARLPRIRIHDFRHSHATLLANNGINIQEIARRLGHSDIKMTLNTYAHLYPRESDRAVTVLNGVVPEIPPMETVDF